MNSGWNSRLCKRVGKRSLERLVGTRSWRASNAILSHVDIFREGFGGFEHRNDLVRAALFVCLVLGFVEGPAVRRSTLMLAVGE